MDFRVKKISIADVMPEDLGEIHKFPFPIQKLIAEEMRAVSKRLQEGKDVPGLVTPECHCKFFNSYLLPCRHIFHQQLCGVSDILTPEVWRSFQHTFEESGLEIYQSRGLVEVVEARQTEAERGAERRRLAINELFELARDQYYRLEENGNVEDVTRFIDHLRRGLEPTLDI